MICFAVYFVGGDTDTAFTCWLIAIPFVIFFIAGAVVARVGDKLQKNVKARIQEAKTQVIENTSGKIEEKNKTE